MSTKINIKNRKASFEYEFNTKYIAGIILTGSEIKSIRNNNVNISNAHFIFVENELVVKNLYIGVYVSLFFKSEVTGNGFGS